MSFEKKKKEKKSVSIDELSQSTDLVLTLLYESVQCRFHLILIQLSELNQIKVQINSRHLSPFLPQFLLYQFLHKPNKFKIIF